MQQLLGWILIIFPGILYAAQITSSINFSLAQKLGLQENPDLTDSILQRAERYTAYWDLVTMGWLPLSGVLMVIDNSAWPLVAFFGGAIYLDAAGREAAKYLSFKHAGIRMGSPKQQLVFFLIYLIMAVLSVVVLIFSLMAILNGN